METKIFMYSLMWLPKLPPWAVAFERIVSGTGVTHALLYFALARPYAIFSVWYHAIFKNILGVKTPR